MIMSAGRHVLYTTSRAVIAATLFLVLTQPSQAQEKEVGEAVREILVEARQQAEFVTVEELSAMMDGEREVTLVDVRTETEYEAGHLRGAVWIPRGKLEFAAAGGKLGSTSEQIVIYCRRDGRSLLAAAVLKRLGFDHAKYLKGGFGPWVTAGNTIYNIHGELVVKEYEKKEEEQQTEERPE